MKTPGPASPNLLNALFYWKAPCLTRPPSLETNSVKLNPISTLDAFDLFLRSEQLVWSLMVAPPTNSIIGTSSWATYSWVHQMNGPCHRGAPKEGARRWVFILFCCRKVWYVSIFNTWISTPTVVTTHRPKCGRNVHHWVHILYCLDS